MSVDSSDAKSTGIIIQTSSQVYACHRPGYHEYIKCIINNNSDGRIDVTRNIFSRLHHFHHPPCTVCSQLMKRSDD